MPVSLRVFYGQLPLTTSREQRARGAILVEERKTAARYRLFSVQGTPALVEEPSGSVPITVQIYDVEDRVWAKLLNEKPLHFSEVTVELDDGRLIGSLLGSYEFVMSAISIDVSGFGSWAAYQASLAE